MTAGEVLGWAWCACMHLLFYVTEMVIRRRRLGAYIHLIIERTDIRLLPT